METLTVTKAGTLAARVIEQIEALSAQIPNFKRPHRTRAARVRAANSVPPQFIHTMIAAVKGSSELQALESFDTDDAQAMLQFNDAFRAVIDCVNLFLSGIHHTIGLWKAEVVADAMRTYAIAKALNRDPKSALTQHLEHLRRDLGRKAGRPRAAAAPSPIRITLAEEKPARRKRTRRRVKRR